MSRRRLPAVAVVGRPNVGKSTFFNRVIGGATAVVDDLPGVTRDRREAEATWNGVPFLLVDTGGLVPGTKDSMEDAIRRQVEVALESSALILFLIDAREGVAELDRDIAERLRAQSDHVILIANKVEAPEQEILAQEGAELGFGPPLTMSGQHGREVGDLLDEIAKRLPKRTADDDGADVIRFTLVGKPNVGKSSLANRLLGEPRLIVHPEAGTTRDAIDVPFRYDGADFVLIDTAGLRRRSHVVTGIEYYSALRTQKSLERSDVVLLVLDATEPLSHQDARIAHTILEHGKSFVFLVNKWDLVEKDDHSTAAFTKRLYEELPLQGTPPVLFVSALTGLRVQRIPALVRELYEERHRRVSTHELNDLLQEMLNGLQPPVKKDGKPLKLYYVTQTGEAPPTFSVFTNAPREIPASYEGYLRNRFRDRLGFQGTPIRLVFRARH